MKCHSIMLALLITTPLLANNTLPDWTYIDFDVSMQTAQFPHLIAQTKKIIGLEGTELLNFFRDLYNKNNPSKITPNPTLKIPKIIHQIWLGGPLPEVYKSLVDGWLKTHAGRGWHYKLWTDEDVKKMKLYNQDLYDASDNYGTKSDILKYEIIYRYGGCYIDTDFECLRPLDSLHYLYDLYLGVQPLQSGYVQLGVGLFAATPKHPVLEHCILTIKNDVHKKGIPARTGPIHFTFSFLAKAGQDGKCDIAFPAHYFYPLAPYQKNLEYDVWLAQGAYGVHHWAKSWMPSSQRPEQFKHLNNDASVQNWNPN